MKNANLYGFLPDHDAEQNAKILQSVVDLGGEIIVAQAGVYDLSETIEIGDDTTLIFAKGVQIRRQTSGTGRNGIAFVNKGAASHTYNQNIKLIGLHLDCNGVESHDWGADSRHVGLRAQVGMIYIKNLVVEDYECIGLLKKDYGIQVSAFEHIRLENLYITGEKDGVHLGWGRDFVIRHGKFCTYDDPIALNAFDYSPSNTHVGWIEDGVIEDCYDLDADTTTGHFCRILGGAWCDWYEGMLVQHSHTVCSNGRVYRVVMRPNGEVYQSLTAPSHTFGTAVYDGIVWVCVRDEAVYNCGCRNIVLRDIHLQKKRPHRAIGISLNNDVYARSYVVGCNPVPQGNIALERIFIENEVPKLLGSNYPAEHLTIKDTDMKDSKLYFLAEDMEGLVYPTVELTLENVIRTEDAIVADGGHPVRVIEK